MKNIETLIDESGSISIAVLAPIGCVAAASDGSNCLVMLVRRDGKSLSNLMAHLDAAIESARSMACSPTKSTSANAG